MTRSSYKIAGKKKQNTKKITKKSQNTKSQKNKKEIYQQETQKKQPHNNLVGNNWKNNFFDEQIYHSLHKKQKKITKHLEKNKKNNRMYAYLSKNKNNKKITKHLEKKTSKKQPHVCIFQHEIKNFFVAATSLYCRYKVFSFFFA